MFLQRHHGYIGVFTREQYPGAWANGTRVAKIAEDKPREGTPLGTEGNVLGSIGHPELGILYFVEWDDKQHVAVAVSAWKVRQA